MFTQRAVLGRFDETVCSRYSAPAWLSNSFHTSD